MKKILAIVLMFTSLSAPSASAAWEFDEIPLNTDEYVAYLPKNSESNKLLVGKPYIEHGRYVVYWSPTKLISYDGELLIDNIKEFSGWDDHYLINNNLYDGDFNKLSDEEYNSMREFDNGCLLLAKEKEGEKKREYVVADGNGKVISTEVMCSESATMAGDYILVEGSDGNYIADLQGKRVSDILFEDGSYVRTNTVLFRGRNLDENDTLYMLDEAPQKLISQMRYIRIVNDSILVYIKQGKCTFYDLNERKELLSCDTTGAVEFEGDYVLVQSDDNTAQIYGCSEKKPEYKGYVNIFSRVNNIVGIAPDKKRVLYTNYKDFYTLCDFAGNVLWEGEFGHLNLLESFFTTDKMVINDLNGMYRHIGLDGTVLYKGEDYIKDFGDKIIKKEDGKTYLCDIYGNKIVDEEIITAEKVWDSEYISVAVKNEEGFNNTGVINEDGSFLIEPIYSGINYSNGYFTVWEERRTEDGKLQTFREHYITKDGRVFAGLENIENKAFSESLRLTWVMDRDRVSGLESDIDYLDIKGESIFEEEMDSVLTKDGDFFVIKRKDGTKAVLIPKESYVCVKLNDVFCKDGIIRNDRTLVPMRDIFERLGYEVVWNGESGSIDAYCGGKHIHMEIGNNEIISDGNSYYSDKAPEIIEDMTYIPVRVLMESLGAEVDWYEALRLVDIQL